MAPNSNRNRRTSSVIRKKSDSLSSKEANGRFKAHHAKILSDCLAELESLPIDEETGRVKRGEKKRIVDVYLEANKTWLTEDMIKSKRKRLRKKTRDEEAARAEENRRNENGLLNPPRGGQLPRPALEDLQPVGQPGRKTGSTHANIQKTKQDFVYGTSHYYFTLVTPLCLESSTCHFVASRLSK